jgi:hypothetical protein
MKKPEQKTPEIFDEMFELVIANLKKDNHLRLIALSIKHVMESSPAIPLESIESIDPNNL